MRRSMAESQHKADMPCVSLSFSFALSIYIRVHLAQIYYIYTCTQHHTNCLMYLTCVPYNVAGRTMHQKSVCIRWTIANSKATKHCTCAQTQRSITRVEVPCGANWCSHLKNIESLYECRHYCKSDNRSSIQPQGWKSLV